MPYTIWSHDRLVGESELDYLANTDVAKTGDFAPTPFGESIMPILTGVRRAVLDTVREQRDGNRDDTDMAGTHAAGGRLATMDISGIAAATERLEELDLQLRGPNGWVIPTIAITITDVDDLLADIPEPPVDEYDELMFPDADATFMDSVEHDLAIIEEIMRNNAKAAAADPEGAARITRPPARYQLHVELAGTSETA